MKRNLTLSVALLTALFTLLAAGTVWKLSDTHTQEFDNQMIERVRQRNALLEALSTTEVCSAWMTTTIGTAGTATSTFDECAPDTLGITTNAAMSANATADNQRVIYQTLCGNGAISVKLDAITASSGFAGLFIRESLSAGSRKVALMSQKGASVFRQLRATNNQFQTQATFAAPSHNYLKLIRTGNNVVGQWSTNGATWNTAFNTPLAVANGCVEIGLFTYSSNSNIAATVVFSGLSYSEPTPAPASVSFLENVLTASPGDSVQICLQANVVCNCDILSPQVALIGTSSPHLTGYTSPVLSFSIEDSLQCFQLAIGTANTNATYGFVLDDLGTAQTGAIDTLWLEVSAVAEQDGYGLCGSFHLTSAGIDSTKELYQDRFGNTYSRNQLEIPSLPTSFNNLGTCSCDEFTDQEVPFQSANYFELFFDDCISGNMGFADPVLGEERRKVACKVFAELANRIERNVVQCPGQSPPKVNIWIRRTGSIVVNGNVLAAASPLYETTFHQMGGIIDGLPWKLINHTGYIGQRTEDIYHGILYVPFTAPFYLGDAEPPTSGDQFDLETVLLHEALHILGFDGGIEVDQSNLLLSGGPRLESGKSYTRFGTRLVMENNDPVVARSLTDPYEWLLNIEVDDLFSSCSGIDYDDGPRMFYKTLEGNQSFPLFTGYPNATPNNRLPSGGSSFSHLDEYCPQTPNHYLMSVGIPRDMRLPIGSAEESILCDLGYDLDGDCGCVVVGNHDILDCNGNLLTFELCPDNTTFSFPVSVLLGNDVNADGIAAFEIISSAGGSMELVGNDIEINPCGPGDYYFRYIPVSSTCSQEGNPVVGRVEVRQCQSCDFYSNTTIEVPRANPCNLLCNGSILGLDCLTGEPSGDENFIGCSANLDLPGWFPATQTPDYVSQGANGSSGAIVIKADYYGNNIPSSEESIYTPVQITSGDYFFSYYTKGENNPSTNTTLFSYNMHISLITPDLIGQFGNCFDRPNDPSSLDITASNHVEIYTGAHQQSSSYVRSSACLTFTDPSEYTAMWFWPEVTSATTGGSTVKTLFIDDVELLPDNFSAGNDIVVSCGDAVVLGGTAFCMLSDVAIRYVWKDESDEVLLTYTVRRGFDGELFVEDELGSPLSQIPALEFTALNSATYTLERSVASGSPFSIDLCTTSDEVTVTVLPSNPADASFTIDNEVCEFEVTVTGTEGNTTHHWDFGDGNSATGQSVTYTYTTTGTYTITHTVGEGCTENSFSEEVVIAFEETPNPAFSYTANCGEVSFSIAGGLPPGATIVYGGGSPTTGSSLTHTYAEGGTYTATLQIPYVCGTAEIPLTVVTPNCLSCEECNLANTIGTPGATTLMSTVGALPSGAQRCIEGTLVIDQNTVFTNALFRMGGGAAIIVESGIELTITNSSLEGCGVLWRGIVVENGAKLAINGGDNSLLADAVFGVHLLSGPMASSFFVRGARFERNFVAVYKGKGVSSLNLLFAGVSVSGGATNLASAYPGVDQLIEGAFLPPYNGKAWAGVWLEDVSQTLTFSGNQLVGLSVGLYVRNSSFSAFQNRFISVVNNHNIPSSPVTLQYLNNIKGCAVYGVGTPAQTLNVSRNYEFSNCQTGIRLESGGLMTASSNTMNAVTNGILLKNVNVGGAIISFNEIQNARKGIQVLHGEPGGELRVSDNAITLNPVGSSDSDLGISLDLVTPGMPGILAAAEVFDNPITLHKGRGIMLKNCRGVKVRNNTEIHLMTTAARAGIWVEGGQSCEITDNTVTGAGITLPSGGTANTANIGINIINSPGNAYCCNTIEDTHVGIRVAGASASEDRLRGNTFYASAKSLYLPDNSAIIGSQEHTKNCWESGSGQAEYGADLIFAQLYPFIVDEADMACFLPGSYSPQEWFQPDVDLQEIAACISDICNIATNFKPDSPDTKRLASGELASAYNYPEALSWELQRYVYDRLQIAPSSDSLVQAFVTQSGTNSIGQLQEIYTAWADVFRADSVGQVQVADWLMASAIAMDSITLIEEQLLDADSSLLAGLLENRAGWQLLADSLGVLADTLMAGVIDDRETLITNLRMQNNGISTSTDYELNEQLVNNQFLAYYVKYEANPDSADLSILTAIANQCPLLGGHGVYKARALLTVLTGLRVEYNDSTLCASQQAIRIPGEQPIGLALPSGKVNIYPNPASDQVQMIWAQALQTTGRLVVYDLLGQVVLMAPIPAGENSHTLPVGQLQNGLYWLQIELDGAWSAHKIMIHR